MYSSVGSQTEGVIMDSNEFRAVLIFAALSALYLIICEIIGGLVGWKAL